MAGEASLGNKEPKELVLAAIYQAKCLQEMINSSLTVKDSDIIAARANNHANASASSGVATSSADRTNQVPLYQTNMNKLMNISSSLSQQLACLLVSTIKLL